MSRKIYTVYNGRISDEYETTPYRHCGFCGDTVEGVGMKSYFGDAIICENCIKALNAFLVGKTEKA